MPKDGGRVHEELRVTVARLRALEAAVAGGWLSSFTERLTHEKLRCERYNHYFSVLLISPGKARVRSLFKRVRGSLRSSDLVGLVGGPLAYRWLFRADCPRNWRGVNVRAVGVLLPETDKSGARTATERLQGLMAPQEEVKIGFAVYPEDATDPLELIRIASA